MVSFWKNSYIKVILLCLVWYSVSAFSNVVGKTILTQFAFPLTLTFVHILVTAILSFPLLYFTQLRSCLDCVPRTYFLTFVLPLAMGKALTMVSGHVAIWKIPVSYAHTVKASTPIFTVILCRILFNERQSVPVYLSLFPIIAGVAIATVTELSFDYVGLLAGLGFTIGISLQNIFNKRLMKCTGIHSFELLSILSRVSVLFVLPVWVFLDLRNLVENRHTINLETDWWTVSALLAVDGVLNFVQNIIAFAFLSLVAPLTYSVANASKRIAIIGVSLIVLRNPVTVMNALGMATAIGGVLLYSYFRARQNHKTNSDKKPALLVKTNDNNNDDEMDEMEKGKSQPPTKDKTETEYLVPSPISITDDMKNGAFVVIPFCAGVVVPDVVKSSLPLLITKDSERDGEMEDKEFRNNVKPGEAAEFTQLMVRSCEVIKGQ